MSEESLDKKNHFADSAVIRFKDIVYLKKDVKEKIQNVQRRIKNVVEMPITHKCYNTQSVLDEIDKIFLEEIGEELLKS